MIHFWYCLSLVKTCQTLCYPRTKLLLNICLLFPHCCNTDALTNTDRVFSSFHYSMGVLDVFPVNQCISSQKFDVNIMPYCSSTSDCTVAPLPDARIGSLRSLPGPRSCAPISGCGDRLSLINYVASSLPASNSDLHPAACKIA